jgi:hypothetical protein
MTDTTEGQLLQQAAQELKKLRNELAKAKKVAQMRHEPIAVIGMSCRLPGGVNDQTPTGSSCARGATPSSTPAAAGSSSRPTRVSCPRTAAGQVSPATSSASTRASSASRRVRPSVWTHSSA